MNTFKATFFCFLFLPSLVFGDPNCDEMDQNTLSYEMMCGEMYEKDKDLRSLKLKVRTNANFILKWRTNDNGSSYDKSRKKAFEEFDELESRGVDLVDKLARFYCNLNLEVGDKISTSGQAEDHSYCMGGFQLKYEEMLYKKMEKRTKVITPSFNCDKASTKVEKTICRSHYLSLKDRSINGYYKKAVSNNVETDQKIWLKTKRNTCENSTDIISCLSNSMKERSEYLYSLTKHL